jgi:hypothetical protein
MSSTINDLKYFLYTCTLNENFNPFESNARKLIENLVNNGKASEIFKEVIEYSSTNNSSINYTNIDATSFVLAVCVGLRKNESLTNNGKL